MALNISKFNHLTPLRIKGLISISPKPPMPRRHWWHE